MGTPELGNVCACEVEEMLTLSKDLGGKGNVFSLLPATRTGFMAVAWHPDKEDASQKSGASLDQLVDQTQCETTLWYMPLVCQRIAP